MNTEALIGHADAGAVVAWRGSESITAGRFLADVRALAAALPAGRHLLNACVDRYRFAVGLAAALVSDRISLLPPTHTADMVARMKTFAPDVFCLADTPMSIDLPMHEFIDRQGGAQAAHDPLAFDVPTIPADRTLAVVFTSGSTGAPLPHAKQWGAMVRNVRAERRALALDPAHATLPIHVLGTVPPQHMYGIESTVLMPLVTGGALDAAHPFYPADIVYALGRLPRPRVLVTTPVHLRSLLESKVEVPALDLVMCATAPLAPALAEAAEAALRAPLQEIYGATETGQIATRRSVRSRAWTPFPGIELEALEDGRSRIFGGHVLEPTPMGDRLEALDDGTFLLHGRLGDLVNIAGKRSSLGHLDHQLLAVPGVVDGQFFLPEQAEVAGGGVVRLAAFVVAPTLDAVALREALRERIDAAFMPRPLMFIDRLPRNSTGKVTRETLASLMTAHRTAGASAAEPTDRASVDETQSYAADHPAFAGHFPGIPIVPGVLLLDEVVARLEAASDRAVTTIGSVKFLRPVAPNEAVSFAMSIDGDRGRFDLACGGERVATGQVGFGPSKDGAS